MLRVSRPPSLEYRLLALLAALLLVLPWPQGIGNGVANAAPLPGGPLEVGGPNFGLSGVPFTWDPAAMPIQYRVDPGPLSVNPSGTVVVNNADGVARVKSMFGTWSEVATASLSFSNAGILLPTGAYTGGPVSNGSSSVANFNALLQSCNNAVQSPVIFDPDGNLLRQLGLSADIIGVSFPCSLDPVAGHIKAAGIVLNGEFQDGISSPSTGNFELTANGFNQAITHEMGHLIGLDHSQINVEVLTEQGRCGSSEIAGLPLMFPFFVCQARVDAGFSALSPDDTAWASRLYPGSTFASKYATISGTVYFSDGITHAQGVNVIARSLNNPQAVAFSVVSGYLFTGIPGQSITCAIESTTCPSNSSPRGSRDTRLAGTFDIPVLPGTYTITVESVSEHFQGGSGVGPLRVPIPMPGTAPSPLQVTVSAGGNASVTVTLVGTPPRFDAFETAEWRVRELLPWQRREKEVVQAVSQ